MAKLKAKNVAIKFESIISDLKNRKYKPVYLLMGEEPYYIDKLSNYFADNILDESEKAFNQLILYGGDTTPADIVFAACRPPMMSPYQVVIVKEAQNVKIDRLDMYLKSPPATTILVLCVKGKSLAKNTSSYKQIDKIGCVFETVKLYENEVPSWIINYLKAKSIEIEPNAADILTDYIGSDLNRIAGELDKLLTLLPVGSKKINAGHIEQNIGISKEYNTFELNNALMSKNGAKAYRIIDYFGKNPSAGPMNLTISSIFFQFCKLLKYKIIKAKGNVSYDALASEIGVNPYFLKDYDSAAQKYSSAKIAEIIGYLKEYDLRSKGWEDSGTDDGELLREMIFKILN